MASHRKPLEGKHLTVKLIAFTFRPHLLAYVNYASLMWWYWISSFNITVLNILRHFKCFYNVLSHCLWLKYCRGCLIWIANGPNFHFVQKYLCFILLKGDLKICGWETDEKLTRLCCSSVDVLPSQVFEPVTWLKTISWATQKARSTWSSSYRMITVWHQSTARAIRKQSDPMHSNRSRGTFMSYGDHSVQRRLKWNAPKITAREIPSRDSPN